MYKIFLTKTKITRLFLFPLVSSSFITPVLANDVYWYGYSWGGMFGACTAYKYNQMSKLHNPYGDGLACKRIVEFIENL